MDPTVDPTTLSDEELNAAVETGVEPAAVPESPQEETPEAPVVEEEPVTEPAAEEEPKEEEPQPSRRESLRIQQLLNKYPELKERAAEPKQQPSDYIKSLDAEPEVIEGLEADRKFVSDEAFQQGLKMSEVREWRRDLKYEAPVVEAAFPFLNPKDSENFKPAAAQAMNQKYLRFIGYNPGNKAEGTPESVMFPDISYKEFVEGEMEFAGEIASQKVAETTKNIAQQAAATGLRPDGSQAHKLNLNQAPENMTDEELYAAIGQVQPKK